MHYIYYTIYRTCVSVYIDNISSNFFINTFVALALQLNLTNELQIKQKNSLLESHGLLCQDFAAMEGFFTAHEVMSKLTICVSHGKNPRTVENLRRRKWRIFINKLSLDNFFNCECYFDTYDTNTCFDQM